MPPVEALLFDLGGVVIHTDHERIFASWAEPTGCDVATIRAHNFFDAHYIRYERGEIEITEYFDHLRERLHIDLSDAQLLKGWNAIFVGEMPGIARLLPKARAKFPLYAFSNTNRAHVDCFSRLFAPVLSHFSEIFLSSTIGRRKPDVAAFDHVVKEIGVPASRIVFFDDIAENVAGAKAAGLQAVQTATTADIAKALAPLLGEDAQGMARL